MRHYSLVALTLLGAACSSNKPAQSPESSETPEAPPAAASADDATTARVRDAIRGDTSLSSAAKDVGVATENGKVTLKGPVKTDSEKAAVVADARRVAGADNVDDQIEVSGD